MVLDDANVPVAGRRIVWGKCVNAGQSCIAPDYILVTPGNRERLLGACQDALKEFFGEDPKASKDYGRIVNDHHFQLVTRLNAFSFLFCLFPLFLFLSPPPSRRLVSLLDRTSGQVVHGGERDVDTRFIAPTLVDGVAPDDQLMQEEIFGPILPFVTIQNEEEAIRFVNERWVWSH